MEKITSIETETNTNIVTRNYSGNLQDFYLTDLSGLTKKELKKVKRIECCMESISYIPSEQVQDYGLNLREG